MNISLLSLSWRYILIKYADRGLVHDGMVSKLFRHLYCVLAATFHILFFCLLVFKYSYDKTPFTLTFCLEKNHSQFSLRLLLTSQAGILLSLIFLLIFYFSATKCQKVKTSKMIGNFQRNIVTFRQTVFFFTIQSLYLIVQKITPLIVSNDVQMQKIIYLYFDLGYVLILPLILQSLLLWNLHETMPMLFYNLSLELGRSYTVLNYIVTGRYSYVLALFWMYFENLQLSKECVSVECNHNSWKHNPENCILSCKLDYAYIFIGYVFASLQYNAEKCNVTWT